MSGEREFPYILQMGPGEGKGSTICAYDAYLARGQLIADHGGWKNVFRLVVFDPLTGKESAVYESASSCGNGH